MDLRKVYEYALMREHEGYDFFATHAEKSGHAAAKGIFRRLADEEQTHIVFVQGLLDGLTKGVSGSSAALADESFFQGRASDEMLDQTMIESMVPDVTVLRVAYLIEKDIAEFYETSAAGVQGEAQKALLKLAHWERGHEQLFKGLHDKVYQEYMNQPWGG